MRRHTVTEKEYNEIKQGKKTDRSMSTINRINNSLDYSHFKIIVKNDHPQKTTKKWSIRRLLKV